MQGGGLSVNCSFTHVYRKPTYVVLASRNSAVPVIISNTQRIIMNNIW